MAAINRRDFGRLALALVARAGGLRGSSGLDEALRAGVARRNIPAAVFMAATAGKTLFTGAYGKREASAKSDLTADAIFRIASMTKAITSTAAMQLVEKRTLALDEPVAKHLPRLAGLKVLAGFDRSDKPILRPAKKPVTLRLLLSHTAGFAYDTWDANLLKYLTATPRVSGEQPVPPLVFEPGARWEYGTNVDWVGRLVEAASGTTLEAYFQRHILEPLGMSETSYILPPAKFGRLVSSYERRNGALVETPLTQPAPPSSFNGGGGLYSTASDYVRFMQMILRGGLGPDGQRILEAGTVELMKANQIGGLRAGILKSVNPARSSDLDLHPGHVDKFGLGFLINTDAYEGGRSEGSLAWAGLFNTYFWIDPRRQICGVGLMQYLPFADRDALGLLGEFERAIYAGGA
ncbi:MAG TPA: serine hydrolase domain-containing protein [Bryobacteraceae bacterium]|nr:serine hydrolase domain-containing protein [Bryobacteraceae bacterium]